jgi:hypothetical protein
VAGTEDNKCFKVHVVVSQLFPDARLNREIEEEKGGITS